MSFLLEALAQSAQPGSGFHYEPEVPIQKRYRRPLPDFSYAPEVDVHDRHRRPLPDFGDDNPNDPRHDPNIIPISAAYNDDGTATFINTAYSQATLPVGDEGVISTLFSNYQAAPAGQTTYMKRIPSFALGMGEAGLGLYLMGATHPILGALLLLDGIGGVGFNTLLAEAGK